MKLIDFNSRPPIKAFDTGASHLKNYRRVYKRTEGEVGRGHGKDAVATYLATYQRLGVERVLIKAKDVETTFGVKSPNEDVAGFCREHGERYVGFAGVDPNKGMAAIRELEFAVRELGMRGLNIQCFEHKMPINDKRLYPLYAKCIELGIPVNIHTSINFSAECLMEHGRPILLDEVMVHFPELVVIASPPGFPWVHELLGVAWRHANVHIGVSAIRPKLLAIPNSGYEALLQYGTTILQDRMIFGTAFPMQPIETAIEEMMALPMKEAVREKWIYGNAARLLGLG